MAKREGLKDYLLRVPQELWDEFTELLAAGPAEDRSANRRIIHLLREDVRRQKAKRLWPPKGRQ